MLSSQQHQMDAVPWKSLRERSDLELKCGKEDEEVLKTRSEPSSAGRKVLHRVFTSTTAEPLSPRGRRRWQRLRRPAGESGGEGMEFAVQARGCTLEAVHQARAHLTTARSPTTSASEVRRPASSERLLTGTLEGPAFSRGIAFESRLLLNG
ncbi:hypothetical protein AK812_SmicGene3768 [Symbiodinium microadriaticum]|uniref:Uncharacterized protein n=1 Tax=Symbiodinium microadriaticum TaxID=2951 RepID=A0A1Q9EXY9_SYMMI|nr:hypothetical protein AK812_SmicGene3768 [Symbiodinium microadriaticum]